MNKIRKRKKLKMKYKLVIIIFLIISLTYFFMHQYLKKINPRIIEVSEQEINKIYRYFLSTNISYDLLKDTVLEDLIIINKNKAGEILDVDFDLEKSYKTIDLITETLTKNINDLEKSKIYLNNPNLEASDQGLILKLPLFIYSPYALLSNLGPQIYMKVNFIGTLLTNIKTKITNYGMNNALIEIYATVEMTQELISPVVKNNQKITYDVLLASKIINGRVPELYGGSITTESNIIEKEIN